MRVLNIHGDDLSRMTTEQRNVIKFCCATLKQQIFNKCSQHGYDCPDNLIQIGVGAKEKFFWCGEAGNASYRIEYCPFCGTKLPSLETT